MWTARGCERHLALGLWWWQRRVRGVGRAWRWPIQADLVGWNIVQALGVYCVFSSKTRIGESRQRELLYCLPLASKSSCKRQTDC